VRWRAIGTDGDLVEEEFRFGVGYALTAAAASSIGPSTAWLSAALRWVLFAGFAIAFGGLIAEKFTSSARAENPRLPALRSWIAGGLLAALAGAAGLAVQVVADAGRVSALWRNGSGLVVSAEAATLLAAIVLVGIRRRPWALLPLLVVFGAEGVALARSCRGRIMGCGTDRGAPGCRGDLGRGARGDHAGGACVAA